MPTTRRRYSKREKATAVIAAEMTNTARAAEATGIPENTLRYWMDSPRFGELRAKTREEAAEGFQVLMHMAQGRLVELIPSMDARDLVILLGVATDKSQLLSGGPTNRVEQVSVTDGFDDHEKAQLAALLTDELERRAGRGDPVDPALAAVGRGSAPEAGPATG